MLTIQWYRHKYQYLSKDILPAYYIILSASYINRYSSNSEVNASELLENIVTVISGSWKND